MAVAEKLTTVAAGEKVSLREGPNNTPVEYTVLGPCEDKTGGHWYCVTHREAFANPMQKDSHIHYGRHKLAWVCHTHGPERP